MFTFVRKYFSKDIRPQQLLHFILCISLLAASIYPISAIFGENESANVSVTAIVLVLTLICLLANYFFDENTSFLVYAILAPISNVIALLCLGNNFEPSANAIATVCFVFMFFKERQVLMFCLISFNVLLTVFSMMYVVAYEPIYGYSDTPYDEVGVFLFTTTWVIMVLFFFNNRNQSLVDKLEHKNQKLVALTEELEYFNYMASHDLIAPIKNSKLFLMSMKEKLDAKEYDKAEDLFQYTLNSMDGMEKLTNAIVSLGATNNSLKNKNKFPIDLNQIVDEVKQLLMSSNQNVKIVSDELPIIMGNKMEFFQLFANIIENGVKYNRSEKPVIELRNHSTNNDLKLSIVDNGIGIKKEYFDEVFNFFSRLHSNQEFQGTGLGLGLCKKIVKAYGGTIELESKVDIGSTFIVCIPEVIRDGQRLGMN